MDQASPWLTPRSTLAATIQPQLGARAIITGTGRATSQPAISSRRRPARSARPPAARLVSALAAPKATTNDEHRRLRGEAEVLLADQRQDASLEADHRADEGVEADQQRELARVLAQAQPHRPAHARRGHAPGAVGGHDRRPGPRAAAAGRRGARPRRRRRRRARGRRCGGARSRSSRTGCPTGPARRPSRRSGWGRPTRGRAAPSGARARRAARGPSRPGHPRRGGPAARRRRPAASRR